jgi:hypothetical protein
MVQQQAKLSYELYVCIFIYLRFEVFTVVIMKNSIFWDVALWLLDVSEDHIASIIWVTRIGGLGTTLALTTNVLRLLLNANVVPSSQIFITLIMDAIRSSETPVLTRATRRNIPEDAILDTQRLSYCSTSSAVEYRTWTDIKMQNRFSSKENYVANVFISFRDREVAVTNCQPVVMIAVVLKTRMSSQLTRPFCTSQARQLVK